MCNCLTCHKYKFTNISNIKKKYVKTLPAKTQLQICFCYKYFGENGKNRCVDPTAIKYQLNESVLSLPKTLDVNTKRRAIPRKKLLLFINEFKMPLLEMKLQL